jgi:hypothetical protein
VLQVGTTGIGEEEKKNIQGEMVSGRTPNI